LKGPIVVGNLDQENRQADSLIMTTIQPKVQGRTSEESIVVDNQDQENQQDRDDATQGRALKEPIVVENLAQENHRADYDGDAGPINSNRYLAAIMKSTLTRGETAGI
jgi:hypothetical protein